MDSSAEICAAAPRASCHPQRFGSKSPLPLVSHVHRTKEVSPDDSDVLALYAATLNEACWHSVLQRICKRLQATGMALLYGDVGAVSAIVADMPGDEIERLKHMLFDSSGRALARRAELREFESPGGRSSGHALVARLDYDGSTIGRDPVSEIR